MTTLRVTADVGKEIAEISSDFTKPIEVIREAIHNAYDAGAKHVTVCAMPEKLPDGRRVLSLEFMDDGIGMSQETLERFFGLGHTKKPPIAGVRAIGFKGHGTKIFYQAQDLFVATRVTGGPACLAVVRDARSIVNRQEIPAPELYVGELAEAEARRAKVSIPVESGTVVRLTDYTADSSRLIDSFRSADLENYLRWFTIYGSFEHVITNQAPVAPFELRIQGSDERAPRVLAFGHAWPGKDQTDLKQLKKHDDRRPFNFFSKTFRYPKLAIEDGYHIDVAALFEGKRARLERARSSTSVSELKLA